MPAACFVSERDEREIGSSEAASIDSQVPTVQDTAITQFVTRLKQYSQRHEAEADSVGVIITHRARIDPEGLPRFLETILAQRAEQPTPLEAFFASRPTDASRIAALRREIAALGPSPGAPLMRDTPEFQAFRGRVRAFPLPPPPYDTLGAPTRSK